MVRAVGIRVPRAEAEATRQRLLEMGALRLDLMVARDGTDVVFPVLDSCGPTLPQGRPFDFQARELRPTDYQDLLDWPAELKQGAPRAFDQVGDIVVVKVPPDLQDRAAELGDALLRFHDARAVFHDRGVKDPYRVRDLERIAGSGDALTQVAENGVRLWVDLSKAYYSPRLASERAREVALMRPGETVADLFGGVAPLGIQAALQREVTVDSVDLNPDAVELAKRNVQANGLEGKVRLWLGDCRDVASELPAADRVCMNLPHGAKHFLDVAAKVAKPKALVHYHEILPPDAWEARATKVLDELDLCGWGARLVSHRVVRNYSPQESHMVFDLQGLGHETGTGVAAEVGGGLGPGRDALPERRGGGGIRQVGPFDRGFGR